MGVRRHSLPSLKKTPELETQLLARSPHSRRLSGRTLPLFFWPCALEGPHPTCSPVFFVVQVSQIWDQASFKDTLQNAQTCMCPGPCKVVIASPAPAPLCPAAARGRLTSSTRPSAIPLASVTASCLGVPGQSSPGSAVDSRAWVCRGSDSRHGAQFPEWKCDEGTNDLLSMYNTYNQLTLSALAFMACQVARTAPRCLPARARPPARLPICLSSPAGLPFGSTLPLFSCRLHWPTQRTRAATASSVARECRARRAASRGVPCPCPCDHAIRESEVDAREDAWPVTRSRGRGCGAQSGCDQPFGL